MQQIEKEGRELQNHPDVKQQFENNSFKETTVKKVVKK